MTTWPKILLATVFMLAMVEDISGNTGIDELSDLPPGEQYRQFSLVLLISGGANPELLNLLAPQNTREQGRVVSGLNPDDYKTPLIRIVDQESMLSGAAILLQFAHDSHADIMARLADINANNPVLVSMVDMNVITEDAIIIRNAIADSIDYSGLVKDEDTAGHLQSYRTQTIRIRNIMEFKLYDEELERLTEEAILSVGGKLDAYQRMFDEEVDSKEFDRQFDAAEYIYNRTEKFDEKAGKLTEEIMKSVILSQSRPVP
jgi:hypothetical protein